VDLAELIRRGREKWPQIEIADALVADHFLDKLEAGSGEMLHAEDLFLACACAAGVEAALAVLEADYLSQVHVFLGRMKPIRTLIDDVKQGLRVRLLTGRPPRIAEYGGRGTLTSWLRVAAIRLAIDLLRKAGAAPPPDDGADPMLEHIGGGDPELEVIKERFRDQVNAALRDAFAVLTAEQRNLLRLSYRDGRSIDEIGALLGAHRSTAARKIAEARELILGEARRQLEASLHLTPAELQSLIRLLRSQLHLSISWLLR